MQIILIKIQEFKDKSIKLIGVIDDAIAYIVKKVPRLDK